MLDLERMHDGKGVWPDITVEKKTVCYAHRVSYEQFVGPIPAGMIVRHDCDNPRCVNPKHLQLGTCQDNSDDMVKRGRAPRNAAKLTDEQVREIRKVYVPYSRELGCKGLGDKYGVDQSAIHNVITGKFWSSVGDEN